MNRRRGHWRQIRRPTGDRRSVLDAAAREFTAAVLIAVAMWVLAAVFPAVVSIDGTGPPRPPSPRTTPTPRHCFVPGSVHSRQRFPMLSRTRRRVRECLVDAFLADPAGAIGAWPRRPVPARCIRELPLRRAW